MFARRFAFPAVVAVAAIALTACAGGGDTGGAASTDTINATLSTDPSGFDPALARAVDDYLVSRMLFDTLLRRDADNQLVGGLASSWEAHSARSYSFTIRDDATCADGSPVTPSVVAASLTRFADPETSSTGRTLATGGATATFTPDDEAGTVDVELSQDWSDFLTGMTLPHTGIVCTPGLDDVEGLLAGTVEGAFTGPYTLVSAQPAVSYELALREDYDAWPEFAEPLEGTPAATVIYTPIPEQSTLATQLLAGGVDLGTFQGEETSRFEDDDTFGKLPVSNMTSYLIFNEREGSIFADDPELRRAVAQAVDPVAFTDVATGGYGAPIASLASSEVSCVNTDESLLAGYDPEAAAPVLEGVSIRLVGTTLLSQGNEYVAEVLRNAGAEVQYDEQDNANWSATTTAPGEWDLTVQGDVNIMGTMTSSLLRVMGPAAEDGGRNKMGLVNDEGFAAVNEAMAIVDPEQQCAAMGQAQASFLERVDAAPLAAYVNTVVTAPGISIRAFGDYLDPATMRITE